MKTSIDPSSTTLPAFSEHLVWTHRIWRIEHGTSFPCRFKLGIHPFCLSKQSKNVDLTLTDVCKHLSPFDCSHLGKFWTLLLLVYNNMMLLHSAKDCDKASKIISFRMKIVPISESTFGSLVKVMLLFKLQWGTERPGMLQFLGSQRVRHNWVTEKQQHMPGTMLDSIGINKTRFLPAQFSEKVKEIILTEWYVHWVGVLSVIHWWYRRGRGHPLLRHVRWPDKASQCGVNWALLFIILEKLC